MAEPVLQLDHIEKSFGEQVVTRVIKGISLTIRAGEFIALVGASGSGKTTLLNMLGLLDSPTRGSLSVLGQDIAGLRDAERTKLRGETIGFIFQFHHLLPGFSAEENVALPMASLAGNLTRDHRIRARELLGLVGLEHRLKFRPNELSGGQQQRVAIARALALKPRLVLADEPTGNLDRETTAEVFQLLRRINRIQSTAFLIVTHDLELAERCDRVLVLEDGQLISDRHALGLNGKPASDS